MDWFNSIMELSATSSESSRTVSAPSESSNASASPRGSVSPLESSNSASPSESSNIATISESKSRTVSESASVTPPESTAKLRPPKVYIFPDTVESSNSHENIQSSNPHTASRDAVSSSETSSVSSSTPTTGSSNMASNSNAFLRGTQQNPFTETNTRNDVSQEENGVSHEETPGSPKPAYHDDEYHTPIAKTPVCDWYFMTKNLCRDWFHSMYPHGALTVEFFVFFYSFGGLALSADHMCDSMETLCDHWDIPEDVGGASFMAFGSAVPEFTVNAISTFKALTHRPDEHTDHSSILHPIFQRLRTTASKAATSVVTVTSGISSILQTLPEIIPPQSVARTEKANVSGDAANISVASVERVDANADLMGEPTSLIQLEKDSSISYSSSSAARNETNLSGSSYLQSRVPSQSDWRTGISYLESPAWSFHDFTTWSFPLVENAEIGDVAQDIPYDVGDFTQDFTKDIPDVKHALGHPVKTLDREWRDHTFKPGPASKLARNASVADLGVGGILGSGLIAFLIIPSLCVLFSPVKEGLVLKRGPLARDVSHYGMALVFLIYTLHIEHSMLIATVSMLGVYFIYIFTLIKEQQRQQAEMIKQAESLGHEVVQKSNSIFRERYSQSRLSFNELGDDPSSSMVVNPLSGTNVIGNSSIIGAVVNPHGSTGMTSSVTHTTPILSSIKEVETRARKSSKERVREKAIANKIDNKIDLGVTALDPSADINALKAPLLGSLRPSGGNGHSHKSNHLTANRLLLHDQRNQKPQIQESCVQILIDEPADQHPSPANSTHRIFRTVSGGSSSSRGAHGKLREEYYEDSPGAPGHYGIGHWSPKDKRKSNASTPRRKNSNTRAKSFSPDSGGSPLHSGSPRHSSVSRHKGQEKYSSENNNLLAGVMASILPTTTAVESSADTSDGNWSLPRGAAGGILPPNGVGNAESKFDLSHGPLGLPATGCPSTNGGVIPSKIFPSGVPMGLAMPAGNAMRMAYKKSGTAESSILTEDSQENTIGPAIGNNEVLVENTYSDAVNVSDVSANQKASDTNQTIEQNKIENLQPDGLQPGLQPDEILEGEEEDDTLISRLGNYLETCFTPIEFLLDWTCPDCRIFEPRENWYPLTFVCSFGWITFFSYFVTIIASNWVHLLGVPNLLCYFGIVLVAVGAEIPDAINSVTVAKRGYGSMSTSSCMGSQISNICLGLGFPWLVVALVGDVDVRVGVGDGLIHIASVSLLVIVFVFYVTTIGFMSPAGAAEPCTKSRRRGPPQQVEVVLGRNHVYLFIGIYLGAILFFSGVALHDFFNQ